MAGASNLGMGSGGRRSLDAEINLVPFIDLLSMCICFLLMTAVWTQLSSVQVKQATGTEGASSNDTKSLDLDVRFINEKEVLLEAKRGNKTFKSIKVFSQTDASFITDLDAQIASFQKNLKSEGDFSAVMITPKEGVSYGRLIQVMDAFRKNKLVNIGIVPVKSNGGTT